MFHSKGPFIKFALKGKTSHYKSFINFEWQNKLIKKIHQTMLDENGIQDWISGFSFIVSISIKNRTHTYANSYLT